MNRFFTLLLLACSALGLGLRWPELDRRPMHNDEAVNAIKFGRLWEQGRYKYDPNEHHGPTLYYATLAWSRLSGAPDFDHFTDNRLRWVTVVFGVGLVLLTGRAATALGPRGVVLTALFTALSPAFIFYSRYFIHEMLLVFFTFLALVSAWRYWQSRQLAWALLAGTGLGLMISTKETFVLNFAAAGIAIGLNQVWNRVLDASGVPLKAPRLNVWHLNLGAMATLVVALLFFTSFFTNASGPLDAVLTFVPWIKRAGGESVHIHPWYFYWQRLLWFHVSAGPVWTEALLLVLAIFGALAGFRRQGLSGANASFVRFLTFYTVLLSGFYTFLAYKTPWCLLGFWHGIILLAGVGTVALLEMCSGQAQKLGFGVLVLGGAAHLGWQAWELNTTYAADQRNPYVYAQTSPEILKLVAQVDSIAAVLTKPDEMLIKVIAPEGDYWPLPWYLHRFKQVGWWEKVPADPYASVMIVAAGLGVGLDENKTHIMRGYFALRPGVPFELYVELGLWKQWLAKHPPAPERE